jgi:Flp pilus assembly protein TadD
VADKKREEIDLRFKQGVAMLQAKNYDPAMTAFHRVLQLAPNMPEAHVNMGFALLGSGKPKAAADFFSGAISLRPEQLNAYYGMAIAREALGDLQGANQAMLAYLHRTADDDPYRAKAEVAVKAWQEMLRKERAATPARLGDGK